MLGPFGFGVAPVVEPMDIGSDDLVVDLPMIFFGVFEAGEFQ